MIPGLVGYPRIDTSISPTQILTNLVSGYSGFRWHVSGATVTSGIMTISAATGSANLVAPSSTRSPVISTLADNVTPAISCSDGKRLLLPSATLGTANSHTFVFVGEPDVTDKFQALFWGGSFGAYPTIGFVASDHSNLCSVYVSSSIAPSTAKTSGLQVLMIIFDATAATRILYRNGVQLASSSYAGAAIGAYTRAGFFGIFDSDAYGAGGKWVEIDYIPAALQSGEIAQQYSAIKSMYTALP